MGRRWGKTVLGSVLVAGFAARGAKVAWVTPTYRNGRPLWRMLRRATATLRQAGLVKVNETERTIEFDPRVGGGFIALYSAEDNGDAMRGEDFDLVVVDEAAVVSETTWTDAIQPTLADRGGKAVLISTPRGRNWFWREWMRGQDPAYASQVRSFTAPTSANPNPRIQRAAAQAQERVPERTYQQEWLAVFVDDAGGVFRNVRACIGGALLAKPEPAGRYAIGIDLAKSADFTVCAVLDLVNRRIVAWSRWNKADWPLTKARIVVLSETWNHAQVWMDSTGVGDPIYDDLRRVEIIHPGHGMAPVPYRQPLAIHPYHFTNASKQSLIDNAVLQVEHEQVHFPPIPELINELEAYEYKRLPSGHWQMNAPSGFHDDCVIAFALACWPLAHQSVGLPRAAIEQLMTVNASAFGGVGIKSRVL